MKCNTLDKLLIVFISHYSVYYVTSPFHCLDAVTVVLFQVLGAFANIPFDTNRQIDDTSIPIDVCFILNGCMNIFQ